MGRLTGIEPASVGTTIRCANQLRHSHRMDSTCFSRFLKTLQSVSRRRLRPEPAATGYQRARYRRSLLSPRPRGIQKAGLSAHPGLGDAGRRGSEQPSHQPGLCRASDSLDQCRCPHVDARFLRSPGGRPRPKSATEASSLLPRTRISSRILKPTPCTTPPCLVGSYDLRPHRGRAVFR